MLVGVDVGFFNLNFIHTVHVQAIFIMYVCAALNQYKSISHFMYTRQIVTQKRLYILTGCHFVDLYSALDRMITFGWKKI